MSDVVSHHVDEIRTPTPRLTRGALIGLLLIAGGSFASGFLHQVVGPLTSQPAVAAEPDVAQAAKPVPIEPVIQPAMQVADAAPKPAPKVNVPDPVPVSPPIAPAPEPVTALAVTDATASAAAPPSAAPEAEPAPPAEAPPT